jgi:hypothetical protein
VEAGIEKNIRIFTEGIYVTDPVLEIVPYGQYFSFVR